MPKNDRTSHRLLVKWGKLEVDAFGIPAICAVLTLAIVLGIRWW